MERGTEWERAAVRARWAAVERTERRARRLLVGTVLLAVAPVLLLLAVAAPTEACTTTGGLAASCRRVALGTSGTAALVLLTVATTVSGTWLCCRAVHGD